jgi:hypothetical protein
MNLIGRGLFVIGGIAVGSFLINHFVFGNTGDALPRSARMGEWRKAEVREACFRAMEYPERDSMAPRMPAGPHRVAPSDHRRAVEMTVALNCYLVTRAAAICEPDNRAYIVDYIGRYYAKKAQMLATARNYGEAEVRNVQMLWDSPRNRAIEQALSQTIRGGRLNGGDFGLSAPEPIRQLLAEHRGAADTCPPRLAAGAQTASAR